MRYSRCLMLAVGVLLSCSTITVLADDPPTCDITFDGEVDNQWTLGQNWEPDRTPDSEDVACIPADKTVEIYNNGSLVEAEAKAIVIYSGLGGAAELKIREGAILSLFEDSWVDGSLLVERGGTLELGDSITIEGDGGSIQGISAGQQGVEPLIFVLYGLTLEGEGSERSESLVLHGRFRIPFLYGQTLTNNAYVVADDPDAPLSILYALAASATSQGGHWIAENGGVLEFKLPVSGSGEWKLVDDESSAIEIHEASTDLSGAVEITHGTLKVFESFDTSGNLIFKSVSGSEPAIEISAGKKAEFGI